MNPEIICESLRGELSLLGEELHAVRLVKLTSGRMVITAELSPKVAQHVCDRLIGNTFTPTAGTLFYSETLAMVGEMERWDGPQRVLLRSLANGESRAHWLSDLRPARLAEVDAARAAPAP